MIFSCAEHPHLTYWTCQSEVENSARVLVSSVPVSLASAGLEALEEPTVGEQKTISHRAIRSACAVALATHKSFRDVVVQQFSRNNTRLLHSGQGQAKLHYYHGMDEEIVNIPPNAFFAIKGVRFYPLVKA